MQGQIYKENSENLVYNINIAYQELTNLETFVVVNTFIYYCKKENIYVYNKYIKNTLNLHKMMKYRTMFFFQYFILIVRTFATLVHTDTKKDIITNQKVTEYLQGIRRPSKKFWG